MDDDARKEQAQKSPLIGWWTATSSYDIYMADTLKEKEADGDNDMPVDETPKHRRQKHQPRSSTFSRMTVIIRTKPRTRQTQH